MKKLFIATFPFLILFNAFSFSGPYTVRVANGTDRPLMVVFGFIPYNGFGITEGFVYQFQPYQERMIRNRAYVFVNFLWDTEVRPIIIIDSTGEISEISRVSTEYLSSRDFHIELPLSRMDFRIDPKYRGNSEKPIGSFSNLDPVLKVQYHYNRKEYTQALTLITASLNKDIETANGIKNQKSNEALYAHIVNRGNILIGILAAYKSGSTEMTKELVRTLREKYPDYYQYLLTFDLEIPDIVDTVQ